MSEGYRHHVIRQHRARMAEHEAELAGPRYRTGERFAPVKVCVKCGKDFDAELRYLCARCERRLDKLISEIPPLIDHLRSPDSVADAEGGRRVPGAGTPLGAAWLAADELESVFEGWLRRTGSGWAGHPQAGEMLDELSRLVADANKKWPMEEVTPKPRHLGLFLKCPNCQIAELYEYKPSYAGQPLTIRCHGKCGRQLDQDQYERLLSYTLAVAKKQGKAKTS